VVVVEVGVVGNAEGEGEVVEGLLVDVEVEVVVVGEQIGRRHSRVGRAANVGLFNQFVSRIVHPKSRYSIKTVTHRFRSHRAHLGHIIRTGSSPAPSQYPHQQFLRFLALLLRYSHSVQHP